MGSLVRTHRTQLPPPLKWAGGKRWQVPLVRELHAAHVRRRLVEPFCGGLAIALALRPAHALLNDGNAHLINFYQYLQRGLTIDREFENRSDQYYAARSRFNELIAEHRADGAEGAALFYYLNRTGFNGLCRFNLRGFFNVPFGRYATIQYGRDFLPYRDLFRDWIFTATDFEAVPLESDDFVYADPPYDVEFTQYSGRPFSWHDQKRAARFLARHPGPVVLTNQATARIERLYRALGFSIQFLTAPRRICCNGNRSPNTEILATRNM